MRVTSKRARQVVLVTDGELNTDVEPERLEIFDEAGERIHLWNESLDPNYKGIWDIDTVYNEDEVVSWDFYYWQALDEVPAGTEPQLPEDPELAGGNHADDANGDIALNGYGSTPELQPFTLNDSIRLSKIGFHCSQSASNKHYVITDAGGTVLATTEALNTVSGTWVEAEIADPIDLPAGNYQVGSLDSGFLTVQHTSIPVELSGVVSALGAGTLGSFRIPFRLYNTPSPLWALLPDYDPGTEGAGIPDGGTLGQVLAKASNADGDFVWSSVSDGVDGADGADGADGVGVPAGGTTGQVLAKASNTDHDTEWVAQTVGGGSSEESVDEDFSGGIAAYTTTDLAAAAGKVSEASAAGAVGGYLLTPELFRNPRVAIKFNPGDTTASVYLDAILKAYGPATAAGSYQLFAQLTPTDLNIYKRENGTATNLAAVSRSALTANTDYWLLAWCTPTMIVAELWTVDPDTSITGTPLTRVTLSTDATLNALPAVLRPGRLNPAGFSMYDASAGSIPHSVDHLKVTEVV